MNWRQLCDRVKKDEIEPGEKGRGRRQAKHKFEARRKKEEGRRLDWLLSPKDKAMMPVVKKEET